MVLTNKTKSPILTLSMELNTAIQSFEQRY